MKNSTRTRTALIAAGLGAASIVGLIGTPMTALAETNPAPITAQALAPPDANYKNVFELTLDNQRTDLKGWTVEVEGTSICDSAKNITQFNGPFQEPSKPIYFSYTKTGDTATVNWKISVFNKQHKEQARLIVMANEDEKGVAKIHFFDLDHPTWMPVEWTARSTQPELKITAK